MEGVPFKEPFFDETISKSRSLPINSKPFRPLSEINLLEHWSKYIDHIEPTAFIFHVSRCGSTLLSQLLGINDDFISLAEVPCFDDILRLPFKDGYPENPSINELLKSAIRFYGQKRTGNEAQLFIKTDSWHIFFWKQIRAIYPNVPFILLYRKPDEVLRSNQKHRGMQAVPGVIEPEVFGFKQDDITSLSLDEYMAKVLERYFSSYLQVIENDVNSLLINYEEGPIAMMEKTLDFSGITLKDELKQQVINRTKFHSKHPGQAFSEDQEKSPIPDYLKPAFGLYMECETIRLRK